MKRIVILILLSFLVLDAGAQVQELSLEQAKALLHTQSRELEIKQAEVDQALQDVKETRSVFLPKVNLSETGVNTNNPLNAFGIKLQQESVTLGDFAPEVLNDPDDISNWNTRAAIEQPLFNMDGIYGRKAAKEAYEAKSFEVERYTQYLEFQLVNQYHMLGLMRAKTALVESSIELVDHYVELSENMLEVGYLNEADLLQLKVRKLELQGQLQSLSSSEQSINDFLVLLLGLEKGSQLVLVDEIEQTPFAMESQSSEVSEERADLEALKHAYLAQNALYQMERAKFMPRINAFGQYDLNDANPFGSQGQSYFVGVGLSWQIFNGGAQLAKTRKAQITKDQALNQYDLEKDKAQLSLEKAIRDLETKEIQLMQAKEAELQAQAAYKIIADRFEQGMEKSTDFIAAQTLLSQKSLELQDAIFRLNMAIYQIQLESN
ncbi:TolC family protein [Flavobacteriaceae bacterium]|nr:TolC family protein [Flavobacteriaceae bacterium]